MEQKIAIGDDVHVPWGNCLPAIVSGLPGGAAEGEATGWIHVTVFKPRDTPFPVSVNRPGALGWHFPHEHEE